MDVTSLIPAIDLPNEFRLTALPKPTDPNLVVATYQTPDGVKPLGEFPTNELNGGLFLHLFPDTKIPAIGQMFLKQLQLPKEFELSAIPNGDVIHVKLSVTGAGGSVWKKTKDVNVSTWNLKEMVEVVGWVREAQKANAKK